MKVKEHFTSRYGNEGVIVEADWNQLELIGFAFLTKDPVLYKLINSGIDLHRYIGSFVLNKPKEEITDKERKELKPSNFELVYGGNQWSLMRNKGMSEEEANKLYKVFWEQFPTAKLNYDSLFRQVEASKYLIDEYTPLGHQKYEGYYKTITGRQHYFKTYDTSDYQRKIGNFTKFKYAEIVNYRCQSFCTADIHLIALGNLFRKSLIHRDKYVLINTVHDSIIADVKIKYLDFSCNLIKNELEYVKEIMKNKFKIEIDLPLTVELKYGKSWGEMKKYELS